MPQVLTGNGRYVVCCGGVVLECGKSAKSTSMPMHLDRFSLTNCGYDDVSLFHSDFSLASMMAAVIWSMMLRVRNLCVRSVIVSVTLFCISVVSISLVGLLVVFVMEANVVGCC